MAAALAALAGVSAWVSLGTQAITNDATITRVAAFPPLWLLAILAVTSAVAALATRLSLARAWPLSLSSVLWLPYFPGAIPAAFLIWQGPIEILVWLVIAAGVLGGTPVNWRPAYRAAALDPRRARWLAGAAVAVCALAAFMSVRGIIPSGDEPHYLAVTQSLLLDRDVRIENNYTRGDYLSYFAGRLRPDYLQRGADGQIYSVHAPGLSVAVLPAFAVAGYVGAVLMVIASVALAAVVTWETAWLLSGSIGGAWIGWAAVFLTTPFFFHSFAIYPDGPAALLVMTAISLLVRLEIGHEASRRRIWAAGIALAALPWFHTRFAVIAAVLGLVLLLRLLVPWKRDDSHNSRAGHPVWLRCSSLTYAHYARSSRLASRAPRSGTCASHHASRGLAGSDARARVAALLTVPLLAAAAWFGYFWMIWGTPSPSAPYGEQTNSAFAYIGRGTTGLLIDQQFGVLVTAPILALAVVGLALLARRHRRFTAEWILIVVPYLFAAASYAMWWGGNSAPARFLVALMPMAALPIAWLWRHVSLALPTGSSAVAAAKAEASGANAGWRAATWLLLLVSIVMMLPRAWVGGGRLLYNNRTGFDLMLDWASQSVDLPRAFPSVHRAGISGAIADAMVWLGAALVMAAVAQLLTRRPRRSAGATWAVIAFTAATAAMAASTVVWARHGDAVVTADRSSVAALGAYRPGWHSTIVQIRPFRLLDARDFARRLEFGTTDRVAASREDPTLLRAASVPAADYEVVTSGGVAPRGALTVVIGRNDPPIEQWTLAGRPAGLTGLVLRLPVGVAGVTVRGDDEARATAGPLRLRAVSVHSPVNPRGRRAVRATRYGRARVFFFDEQAYLEPAGFWTRAGGTATVVIDADENTSAEGLRLSLRAGAVATTIEATVGEWRQRVTLAAGQSETVTLPPTRSNAWSLTLASGAGFRPSAIDPASDDVRNLAVWVEIREP